MKAYVYDTGWSGAEIYFAETDEEGIEFGPDMETVTYKYFGMKE